MVLQKTNLCHSSKDWIVATDARSILFIILLSVTYLVELRLQMEQNKAQARIQYFSCIYILYTIYIYTYIYTYTFYNFQFTNTIYFFSQCLSFQPLSKTRFTKIIFVLILNMFGIHQLFTLHIMYNKQITCFKKLGDSSNSPT